MILKASQRGAGKQLALHLMKTEENEHVEVHEIRGFVSDDVVGAFKEAHAVSKGTRCKQFLFSLSLNPPPSQNVPIEVFERTLDQIEEKMGLTGQPRVVVFHEKEARRHCHAVWSRIDADKMKAINLSHFKLKLRDMSKQLYFEHGWKMPRGLMDSQPRDPRNFSLDQWQQAKRMGLHASDLRAMMQECWAVSDSKASFAQALKERGLILARGDRRSHVAVTHEGEVLSIARYIGKRAKDVRARLGDEDSLPGIDATKAKIAEEMGFTIRRHIDEAKRRFSREMKPLETARRTMAEAHRTERKRVDMKQKERWATETRERAARFARGFKGLWDHMTGKHADISKRNQAEAYAALCRDRAQRQALIDAQLAERRTLQTRIHETRQRYVQTVLNLRRDRQAYAHMADGRIDSLRDRFVQAKESGKSYIRPASGEDRLKVLQEKQRGRNLDRGTGRKIER